MAAGTRVGTSEEFPGMKDRLKPDGQGEKRLA